MTNKSALGILFRIPVIGKVKKRLAVEMGEKEACNAYERMLHETIKSVSRLRGMDLYGFYKGERSSLKDLNEELPLYSQKGINLGERMCNAIKWLFHKGYEEVSLIGADSPDLPLSFIEDAFRKLGSHDLVIGPSEDGGYYLIGMNKPHEVIFEGIQWGRESVLKDTICRAKAAGNSCFLLPQWYDIDDLDSFNRWKLKNLAYSEIDSL